MPTSSTDELEKLWSAATLIDSTEKSFGGLLGPEDHYGFVTPLQPAHRLLAAEHYLRVELVEAALGKPFPDEDKPVITLTISGLGKVVHRPEELGARKPREPKKWDVDSLLAFGQEPEKPKKTSGDRTLLTGDDLEFEQPYLGTDSFTWDIDGNIKSRTEIYDRGLNAIERARANQNLRFFKLLGRYMAGPTISVEETRSRVKELTFGINGAVQTQSGMLRPENLRYLAPDIVEYSDTPKLPISHIEYRRKTQLVPDASMPHISSERFSSTWFARSPDDSRRVDLFLRLDRLMNVPTIEPDRYVAVLDPEMTGADTPIGLSVERWELLLDKDDKDRDTKGMASTVKEAIDYLEPLRDAAQVINEHATRFLDKSWQEAKLITKMRAEA